MTRKQLAIHVRREIDAKGFSRVPSRIALTLFGGEAEAQSTVFLSELQGFAHQNGWSFQDDPIPVAQQVIFR